MRGGVLLLGLASVIGWCPSWLTLQWFHLVAVVAIFYVTGFGLRLLGTIIPILVISTDRPGLLGDPWEVRAEQKRRWWHWPWRSHNDDSIIRVARMMLGTDDPGAERAIRREAMFLHISGNLGLALLILFVIFSSDFLLGFLGVVATLPRHWWCCIAMLTTTCRQVAALALLLIASAIFIYGNYIHARSVRMLMRTVHKQ